MKGKYIIALLLMVAGVRTMTAQKVVLHMANNQKFVCDISRLDSITIGYDIEEHEWVDLGLPSGTLWATCNIGANSPEEYGDYFAWGETIGYNGGKTRFDWFTYKHCDGSMKTMNKYCTMSEYGTVDNITELEPADDAATVNWGSGWQMPSSDQFAELLNSSYTTAKMTTFNSEYGYKITSNTNGNSIFLPAAGVRTDSELSYAGKTGQYWSRTLHEHFSYGGNTCAFSFLSNDIWSDRQSRCCGLPVRPVRRVYTR